MSSSQYIVDANREPGRVWLAPDQTWPVVQSRINAVEVTFVAGFGLAVDVPQDLKSTQLLLLGHLYENREATTALNLKMTPLAVESLLRLYDWGFYG